MRTYLHGIVICCVLPAVGLAEARADEYVWKDGKWVPAAKPAEGTPAGELALIRMHLDAGDRKKAIAASERFLAKYPDNPSCEEAMLLAGQAELNAGRYYQAYEQFEELLDRYPNGQFLERVLAREVEVANAFLAGKKRIVAKVFRLPAKDEGLDILRRVAEHAPGSLTAENALLRIGEYHFEQGEYAESAEAYDEYLQLFPKSVRAPHAMVQAARAMFSSFKGVAYDETPLVEAEQRFKVIIDQYPDAARKARAKQVLKQIAGLRAERIYETGRFYTRTGRPEAARFYYQQVVDEYSDSAWAKEAQAALGGKPAGKPKPEAAPETTPKPTPRTQPAPKAAPKPKPTPKPTTKPTQAPGPVDLEKLADPSRKGGTK